MCIFFFFFFFFFAYYAEIQDGHQKWREHYFGGKSPVDSADTLRVKNFVQIAVSSTVIKITAFFVVYAEIQNGCQKWRENYFRGRSSVYSADTLWVKNFIEIALACSVSEINTFL